MNQQGYSCDEETQFGGAGTIRIEVVFFGDAPVRFVLLDWGVDIFPSAVNQTFYIEIQMVGGHVFSLSGQSGMKRLRLIGPDIFVKRVARRRRRPKASPPLILSDRHGIL